MNIISDGNISGGKGKSVNVIGVNISGVYVRGYQCKWNEHISGRNVIVI